MIKSQKLIKIIMPAFIFLIFLNSVYALNQYYILDLKYDYGNISLIKSSVEINTEIENFPGEYTLKILAFDGGVLHTESFEIPKLFIYDIVDPVTGNIIGGDMMELNETNFSLKLPYYKNTKSIEIYDVNSTKLLTIDVSMYAKNLCGDGTCQSYESEKSCPADCLKPAAPAGGNEETGKTFVETAQETLSENYTGILIAVLAVILIALVIVLLKKKPREER